MMKTRLIKRLEQAGEDVKYYLLQNRANDIAQYKYATGQLNGLEVAINICKDIYKGENDDEF